MPKFQLVDLIIDSDAYTVSRDGNPINLPKLSFDLLLYLLKKPQTICSLEDISAEVWKR